MHRGTGMERIGANAEAAGECDVGLDRLVGRNRDHAVLQLVELLPAVEQRLKVGLPALSNGPPTPSAADAGRADAELLQLGGGDLVANVKRLRDERGLRELLLLDPGERAVLATRPLSAAAAISCGIDLLAGERGFDQRLALFDLTGAGFGRVRNRLHGRADGRSAGSGVAGPADQPSRTTKKNAWTGAERRKRRSLEPSWTNRSRSRNKAVVAAKTCVICPRSKTHSDAHEARSAGSIRLQELPSPAADARIARRVLAKSDLTRGWLTNSTFMFLLPGRVVR